MEEKIKKMAIEDNLQDYVHFLGYQKNPYKYMSKMKCILSMSKQEGFSGAIAEGLILGIPFVSTDVGGVKELSSGGKFGIIATDVEDASKKIFEYLNGELKFSIDEMSKFINQFSIERQILKITKLFE